MPNSDNRPAFRLPWQSVASADADSTTGTALSDPPAWPSHDLARRQTRNADPSRAVELTPTEQSARETTPASFWAPAQKRTPAAEADASADIEATAEVAADAAVEADAATDVATGDTEQTIDETTAALMDATAVMDDAAAADAADATQTEPAAAAPFDAPAAPDGDATTAAAETPDATTDETRIDMRSHMTETAVRPQADFTVGVRGRKPTKFLADLTRAMRHAADEAREGTMAQFQGDVKRHTEDARAACEASGAAARERADQDIAALGEWETSEIARIRRETEEGIMSRHGRLETELADQARRLDEELARVQESIDSFGAEMETFFQGLLLEDDPSNFASLAEQLPEPPSFAAWTGDALTWTPEPITDEASDGSETVSPDGELAVPEAATDLVTHDATAVTDTDTGMPPMRPGDFAAAEAEAADWLIADDSDTTPNEAILDSGSDLADATPTDQDQATPWPPAVAAPSASDATRTQVAVVGLVSVASIATFKRLLGRVPGIRAVQVASGPDGEFLFSATHDEAVNMAAAVMTVQGFEVRVVESRPGMVMAQAVDPEIV